MFGAATDGFAQSQNSVTLKLDGGEGVTGELIGFADGMFRIKGLIGLIAIPAEGVQCIGAACPEGTRLETTGERIVLTTLDGSMTVSGDFLEISDKQYVIATDIGEMRIDISKVNCEGVPCEENASTLELGGEVVLSGASGSISGILIDDLADAYLVDVQNVGIVRVSKEAFTCTGVGCP